MIESMTSSLPDPSAVPHRIVIVGGDAGGLELSTRLGDTLGRKGLAHVTLIDYKMHQVALHGYWKTALGSASRLLTRSTEPRVKLH